MSRHFLIDGDPGYVVLMKWQAVGVCCVLDETEQGFDIINFTWPTTETPPVPEAASDELGQYYDEILAHLKYWKETREHVERIRARWPDAE